MNNREPSMDIYKAKLKLCQSVNPSCASIDDIVTYTTKITNTGSIPVFNVIIVDLLLKSLEFINGSVEIDGVKKSDLNIQSGIEIEKITGHQTIILTFKAKVKCLGCVNNQMYATYEYKRPDDSIICDREESNIASVCVLNINLIINKLCDKKVVLLNDIINYTITLNNQSEIDLINVLLSEDIPHYVEVIPGSFMINNDTIHSIDLNQGINIPCILKSETLIIKYSVRVVSTIYTLKISDCTKIRCCYKITNSSIGIKNFVATSGCDIEIKSSSFKQINIEEYLTLPKNLSNIESINNLSGDIDILKFNIFESNNTMSTEGQKSTGYKVFIHGVLNLIIEYTSFSAEQNVHALSYKVPFSTFIVLPLGYSKDCDLVIESNVEDIYYNDVGLCDFYISACAIIYAKIVSS